MRIPKLSENTCARLKALTSMRPPASRRAAVWLLVFAALPALLAGCGKKAPPARLTPLPENAVVLLYAAGIGDEADFFRSATMDEALSKALKRRVVSMGQAGEFADSALKRLPDILQAHDPDLMIVGYGAMDLWKVTDRAKLKASLIAMIDLAQQQDTQVVMLALPDLNRLSVKPDPLFEEVAREKGVPIETDIIRAVLKDSSTKVFRYMVNDKGLEQVAGALRALCVTCGGLKD